jgi:uncharacterized phage-associated protein
MRIEASRQSGRESGGVPRFAAPLVGYRSRKAAQLSAYFTKLSGGQIDKLKLIKLVYMTERGYLGEYDTSLLFDEMYSLPHGPICSSTLNGIDGVIHEHVWSDFITRHGRDKIHTTRALSRDDLDELSDAAIAVADRVWAQFKSMSAWEIRDWTHNNCPEYTETQGRIPISYKEILDALGNPEAEAIDQEIRDLRRAESALRG